MHVVVTRGLPHWNRHLWDRGISELPERQQRQPNSDCAWPSWEREAGLVLEDNRGPPDKAVLRHSQLSHVVSEAVPWYPHL